MSSMLPIPWTARFKWANASKAKFIDIPIYLLILLIRPLLTLFNAYQMLHCLTPTDWSCILYRRIKALTNLHVHQQFTQTIPSKFPHEVRVMELTAYIPAPFEHALMIWWDQPIVSSTNIQNGLFLDEQRERLFYTTPCRCIGNIYIF